MSMPSVCAPVVSVSALIVLVTASALWSQPSARQPPPVIGKSARYCNPLPLRATSADGSPQGVSLGDVTVVREGDLYYLTIDLGSTTQFADEQLFTVDSSRIEFTAGRGGRGGPPPGGQQPPPQRPTGSAAFRYKIEASRDGQSFTTMLDKTGNNVTRYTEFDELTPTQCRYVRMTITDWPHLSGTPLGITEFTVFGKAVQIPKP